MNIHKITKKLRDSVIEELDKLDESGLKSMITEGNQNVAKAIADRNDNENYKQAKSVSGDFDAALRDVKDYQGAKIAYGLLRLREMKGDQIDGEVKQALDEVRVRIDMAQRKARASKATT